MREVFGSNLDDRVEDVDDGGEIHRESQEEAKEERSNDWTSKDGIQWAMDLVNEEIRNRNSSRGGGRCGEDKGV